MKNSLLVMTVLLAAQLSAGSDPSQKNLANDPTTPDVPANEYQAAPGPGRTTHTGPNPLPLAAAGFVDCCMPHQNSGCNDSAIETCVCAQDLFCCNTEWDAQCVSEVALFGCGPCVDCNSNAVEDALDIAGTTSLDCNNNQIPDECDQATATSADCNNNGRLDLCDVTAGTSADCNDSGVPDECETDCNNNGLPDECDLEAGTSTDCNDSGVPDECETDCNNNGLADECDLEAGTSPDCNDNFVPDECDLPFDFDGNDRLSLSDYAAFSACATQPCVGCEAPIYASCCGLGDFDRDGDVDLVDAANLQAAWPFSDCNLNGVPDSFDILGGTSSDCNANIFPDECDVLPQQQVKLIAVPTIPLFELGYDIAVSGDTVVAGTRRESAYVFVCDSGDICSQHSVLTVDDTNAHGFGASVALRGDTAVIGAFMDVHAGLRSGSAFVFDRDPGGTWTQVTKLTAADAAPLDEFGISVTVSDDIAVIGSRRDDDGGPASGSAYVFKRDSGGIWSQYAKLVAPDTGPGDEFGTSVDIDGTTIIVGVPHDSDAGADAGSAYVFARNAIGIWTFQAKLTALDAAPGDLFGQSVAISGDVILVGADGAGDAGSNSGTAYVFERGQTAQWIQKARLTASDAAAGDEFGFTVSLSGRIAAVGAHFHDNQTGAAYAFVRGPGGEWSLRGSMTASDGVPGDRFATSIAVRNDRVYVGASWDDDGSFHRGSAYIFRVPPDHNANSLPDECDDCNTNGFSDQSDVAAGTSADVNVNLLPDECDIAAGTSADCNTNGIPDEYDFISVRQLQQLVPSPPPETTLSFTSSVGIDGDTAVLGDSFTGGIGIGPLVGEAYVFIADPGGTWSQQAVLTAADADEFDEFGFSVSISGDTAIVGAPFDDDAGMSSGSAYVFVRDGNTWSQQAKLVDPEAASGDEFGIAVSISDDTVAIAAPYDIGPDETFFGAVYIFVRGPGGTWSQQAKLTAGIYGFGDAVALSGDTVVVGATTDQAMGTETGAAYVFVRTGESWAQSARLTPADGAFLDVFGSSVAISGSRVVVGAPFKDDLGENSGAAYVYARDGGDWNLVAKLTADDAAQGDEFGYAVALNGDNVIVSAPYDDDAGADSGSAYVFGVIAGSLVQQAILNAADAAEDDEFGVSMGLSGGTALIAAPGNHDAGNSLVSSAYLFRVLPADQNSNGVPDACDDCNTNGIFDLYDIIMETSTDCDFSGTPDECDINDDPALDCNLDGIHDACPPMGELQSAWSAAAGFWNIASNWCPPIVAPDNSVDATFAVSVSDSSAVVTLNVSPTISTLACGDGALIEVNDSSGASIRTLAVDGVIYNDAIIRATDRERLVLDAPEIDQSSNGVLEATDGDFNTNGGPDLPADKSILEINGARVVGGTARAVEPNSEIHLIGGAELVNVNVEGVVVPDGQSGGFEGDLVNSGVLRVAPGAAAQTFFAPGDSGGRLLGDGGGDDCVRLGGQSAARLGSFKSSFVNDATHAIDGAGIIYGGMVNEGSVTANMTGQDLILLPPGAKTNNGQLIATSNATLRIATPVAGAGTISADGGTIRLKPNGGTASLSGASLDVTNAGAVEVDADAAIAVSGVLTLASGGAYRKDPAASATVTATLSAASVQLLGSGGPPARFELSDQMAAEITGNLSTLPCGSLLLGCTPVLFSVNNMAQLTVLGDLNIQADTDLTIDSAQPVRLSGNFDNAGQNPAGFNWLAGALTLDGNPQQFEVAGADVGANPAGLTDNFAIGMLELAPTAKVVMTNQRTNTVGTTPCEEALYIDTLILRPGAGLILNHVHVYYLTLIDEGASFGTYGCGELIPIAAE